MKITNRYNLPEPVVAALAEDNYSRGESNRSVTQLIDAPRYRILKHEYHDRIEEDASNLVWLALGKAVHTMFERHARGKYLPEERLFADVLGWTISGAVDIQFNDQDSILYDYKCTSVWSVIYGKPDWERQLNFYAWLARQHKGVEATGLSVVAILRDWSERDKLRRGDDYPPAPIMEVPIKLWTPSEQDVYVHERVRIHQQAEFERLSGGSLPHCTDEERWKKSTTYAVKKPKNKTAKRVLSSLKAARDYIAKEGLEGFEIETRHGEATRCERYCHVAEWCDQFQKEKDTA